MANNYNNAGSSWIFGPGANVQNSGHIGDNIDTSNNDDEIEMDLDNNANENENDNDREEKKLDQDNNEMEGSNDEEIVTLTKASSITRIVNIFLQGQSENEMMNQLKRKYSRHIGNNNDFEKAMEDALSQLQARMKGTINGAEKQAIRKACLRLTNYMYRE